MKQLKAELQTKLDLPGWISCGSTIPNPGVPSVAPGLGKIDLVEGIKEFRPKLDRHVFPGERKILICAKDPVPKCGSSLRVSPQVAKTILRGDFESSRV